MHEDTTATALLGLEGVNVVEVDTEPDGGVTVYVQTAVTVACPDCATPASRVKECLAGRVRDMPHGGRRTRVVWCKRRWLCTNDGCPRGSFTESMADLPARARVTPRLRAGCADAVAGSGRSVAEAAASHQVSWHTAHDAFTAVVDPLLAIEPAPMAHLGIDEVRRGRPRFERDPDTGETRQLADRWHAGFSDLSGGQGLLGQVEGRSSADVMSWLAQRSLAWRAGVVTVSIDMCPAFRSAARRMLPNATICVDAFHLVQLANNMVNTVRRRIVRAKYGRRGTSPSCSPSPAPSTPGATKSSTTCSPARPTPAAKASTGSKSSTPAPRSATETRKTNAAAPVSRPCAPPDGYTPSHRSSDCG